MLYVVKSKVAREAISCGDYIGKWVSGKASSGGYFYLAPIQSLTEKMERFLVNETPNVDDASQGDLDMD